MTKKEFSKHFAAIVKHLGLSHRELDTNFVEDSKDNMGKSVVGKVVSIQRDHLFAEIEFDLHILKYEDFSVIEVVFHELLHVCMGFYKKDAVDNMRFSDDEDDNGFMKNLLHNSIHHQEEIMIATMAAGLAKMYLSTKEPNDT